MSDIEQPLIHSGYMEKKGGALKPYRRRLFELRGKTLFYYKEGKKSPCGMIFLTETTVEKDATRPRILKIQGRNLNRVIEIMAESDEAASEWVDILNQTIGKITPR